MRRNYNFNFVEEDAMTKTHACSPHLDMTAMTKVVLVASVGKNDH
jgi:hypothetical protein